MRHFEPDRCGHPSALFRAEPMPFRAEPMPVIPICSPWGAARASSTAVHTATGPPANGWRPRRELYVNALLLQRVL